MARPRIGISALAGATPPRALLEAVAEAGGEPVPVASPGAGAPDFAGLVLPGGPDFVPPDPAAYPSGVRFRAASPERLALDRALLAAARAQRRPVLAICYGMQLLALERGGALVYDVATERPEADAHRLAGGAYHAIVVEAGTRLAAAIGAGERRVNSRHHQAVSDPGRGLRVSARARDGVVEAIEADGAEPGELVLGVQWHPEDMDAAHRAALFGALCEAAARAART